MVNAVEKNKFAENNARMHNEKTKTDDLDIVKLKRKNELLKQELEFLKKITNQVK